VKIYEDLIKTMPWRTKESIKNFWKKHRKVTFEDAMEEYSGNKFCFNFDEKPEAHKEQAPVFYNRYVKKVTSNMEEDYYGGVKLTEREKEDLTS
jgi:hypothetical protein